MRSTGFTTILCRVLPAGSTALIDILLLPNGGRGDDESDTHSTDASADDAAVDAKLCVSLGFLSGLLE